MPTRLPNLPGQRRLELAQLRTGLLALMLLLGSRATSRAEAPDAVLAPAPLAALPPAPVEARTGIWFSAKLGLSVVVWPWQPLLSEETPREGSFGLELGFPVDRARRLHLIVSLQAIVYKDTYESLYTLLLPVGLQYDVPVGRVRGLSFYPRLQLGYGQTLRTRVPPHCAFPCKSPLMEEIYESRPAALILPELGIKYVLPGTAGRLHLGMDFFSLPLVFTPDSGTLFSDQEGWTVRYRFLLYGGLSL